MDPKGTQEWTSYEIAELKVLVAKLRNEKSCDWMEAIAKRFPSKNIQQLTDKYYQVFVEMVFDEKDEEQSTDGASRYLHDWCKNLVGNTHDSVLVPSVETPLSQPSKQLVFEAAVAEAEMEKSHCESSRKRRQPWTAEEHRMFEVGVKRLGRGQWKYISEFFVPSRTPAQLASHAQKHFIKMAKNELDDRRQRQSLNDARLVDHEMNNTAPYFTQPWNGNPDGSNIPPPVVQGSHGAANSSFEMVPINQGNLHLNLPPF